MSKQEIIDYVETIRACDNPPELNSRYGIYDNWPILFFGEDIYPKPLIIFDQDSAWKPNKEKEGNIFYVHNETGVVCQSWNRPYHAYAQEENQIDGNSHSTLIMFHPKLLTGPGLIPLRDCIADYLEYLVQTEYTFRIPKLGELDPLNHNV